MFLTDWQLCEEIWLLISPGWWLQRTWKICEICFGIINQIENVSETTTNLDSHLPAIQLWSVCNACVLRICLQTIYILTSAGDSTRSNENGHPKWDTTHNDSWFFSIRITQILPGIPSLVSNKGTQHNEWLIIVDHHVKQSLPRITNENWPTIPASRIKIIAFRIKLLLLCGYPGYILFLDHVPAQWMAGSCSNWAMKNTLIPPHEILGKKTSERSGNILWLPAIKGNPISESYILDSHTNHLLYPTVSHNYQISLWQSNVACWEIHHLLRWVFKL